MKEKKRKQPTKSHAIVVCCSQDWLPQASTTLLSCANYLLRKDVDFVAMILGGKAADKKLFKKFFASRGLKARWVALELSDIKTHIPTGVFGPSSLIRLHLEKWLAPQYKRVLYLDSDVLAVNSIDELFDIDMMGQAVAAVEDWGSFQINGQRRIGQSYFDKIGFPRDSIYFNSGVMLFEWQMVRNSCMLERCISLGNELSKSRLKLRYPDQDVLNIQLQNRWHALPLEYNALEITRDLLAVEPVFVHFAGTVKPWERIWTPQNAPYRRYYEQALQGSAWQLPSQTKLHWRTAERALLRFARNCNFLMRNKVRRYLKYG